MPGPEALQVRGGHPGECRVRSARPSRLQPVLVVLCWTGLGLGWVWARLARHCWAALRPLPARFAPTHKKPKASALRHVSRTLERLFWQRLRSLTAPTHEC